MIESFGIKGVKSSLSDISIEKYIETSDDWFSNYEGNKVKIKLLHSKFYKFVRLSVWGNDDYGLELNFHGTDKQNVKKFEKFKELYDNIPNPCTKQHFENLGFTRA